MLIDSLAFTLEKSGCLDAFWGKLDAGEDATLGVAASARPFLVAARFAHAPQPTLVVVAGEDAAVAFARNVAAYVGEERVLRFPERADYPFDPKPADRRVIAQRMEAAWALKSGREVVVVASARALLRLADEEEQLAAAKTIIARGLNVAQTEEYIELLLRKIQVTPPHRRPTFILKDVRLFLNSLDRSLSLMRSAGVDAACGRQDTEDEILLTIRIPKARRVG